MAKVSLGYKPRDWQMETHNNRKRWNVIVCHRRAGKTNMASIELIKGAMQTSNARFAYIAPTYKQAKNIAWDMIKNYARPIHGVSFNESELRVDFANGSRISLYGADNPDSLRGIALWGVVFDEYAQQPSNIFTEIVRPALSDNKGWAIWIGTPKGKNAFYDLYEFYKTQDNGYTKILRASESGVLDAEELDDARRQMTEEEYAQEYECSFQPAIKGAYYAKEIAQMRTEERVRKALFDPMLPVYTSWDLGMSDTTAILFFQLSGGEVRIIDEYEKNGEGLPHYANYLREKNYSYGGHYFPHDIQVRDLSTGSSRLEIMEKALGRDKCHVVPKLGIMDGINAARLMFAKTYFEESKTKNLLNSLAQYSQKWDDKKGMFMDRPDHNWTSHFSDAFRYLGVTYKNITTPDSAYDDVIVFEL